MTNEDATYIAELQAQLTPDFETTLDALLDAWPRATDADIREALKLLYPEVYARNQEALFELGLFRLIIAAKESK